jgi:hypothetical protein
MAKARVWHTPCWIILSQNLQKNKIITNFKDVQKKYNSTWIDFENLLFFKENKLNEKKNVGYMS